MFESSWSTTTISHDYTGTSILPPRVLQNPAGTTRILKFWIHLVNLSENSIAKQCLQMSSQLAEDKKPSFIFSLTLNILAGHICPDKYSLTSGERQIHFLGPGNE